MIVPTIDLRSKHGAIRDQGRRPTCLAFALSELNRFHAGAAADLSPEYLYVETARQMAGWKPGEGLNIDCGLQAVGAPGQPDEASCPYQPDEPPFPLLAASSYHAMHRSRLKRLGNDLQIVTTTITAGSPVGLVVQLTQEFFDPQDGAVEFSNAVIPWQSHAVVAVGLGTDAASGETHVLIRNSWGPTWGTDGHAWLPGRYVDKHTVCVMGL
jgi:hypothetical protein